MNSQTASPLKTLAFILISGIAIFGLTPAKLMASTSISLTQSPNPAVAGQNLTYTIRIVEGTGKPCRNVRLSLTLPLIYVAITAAHAYSIEDRQLHPLHGI